MAKAISDSSRSFACTGVPAIVVAAILCTYWPSLGNQFVRLDDHVTVYQNPRLIRLSWESISNFWLHPQLALYAPLTYMVYAVVALFSRTRAVAGSTPKYPFHPAAFHAVDLGLHVLSALVVYAMIHRLIRRKTPAAIGALLFGLHPVQVESVCWVTETSNLLSGLFSLLAVYLYMRSLPPQGEGDDINGRLKRARRSWFLLATEAFLLALFSKPVGVIVPALAGVIYWLVCWPAEKAGRAETSTVPDSRDPGATGLPGAFLMLAVRILSKVILRYSEESTYSSEPARSFGVPQDDRYVNSTPHQPEECSSPRVPISRGFVPIRRQIPWNLGYWVLMAAPFALIARAAQPVPKYLYTPLWMRPLIAGDAVSFYLYKILWPELLLADYDRSPKTILHYGWIYYTWIFAGVMGFMVIWLWRHRQGRPLLAGAIWFIVALLPVLGLTPFVYQALSTVADRYLYLPMFGVALGAAWAFDRLETGLNRLVNPLRIAAQIAFLAAVLAILCLFAMRTSLQTRYWHDSTALFDHTKKSIGREPGAQEYAPAPDQMPIHPPRQSS